MPDFALSKEQAAAVKSFGADLGVSAGAGSGKTTVLVERYLEAVTAKGAWPENILAVTFTDKAANVMKERLRRRTLELGLHEAASRLDGAWIGTIHSFCARFLKENPIECGVDPLFSVLGKGEQEMVMEEVLERLFEEEASSALFIRLLTDVGEDAVRSSLKAFYDKLRAYAGQKELLRVEAMDAERLEAQKRLTRFCEERAAENGDEPQEKLRETCAEARSALKTADPWERRRLTLEAIAPLKMTNPKTKESVRALRALVGEWAALEVQVLAVPFKNEWKRLAARFHEAYEKEKRRLAAYDFDDLLDFTWRALSGASAEKKALRARIQKHFEYVFVDEYQDTSLLQAKIIGLVARPKNLFVVGDVRQSIYRFRHAHPEIFLEALKRSKRLSLAENYRSRPEILEAANKLFAGIFEDYEPLVPRRRFTLKKEHCIEYIGVPKDERRLEALRVIEARTIASRIRELVDSGLRVEDKKGGPRAARWGDFAILMRKTTASHLYEKELEAFGVPYFVNKGRGFYEQIEVADLVNLLRVIENPAEDIPMAAVLRSPLAGLSDDALYWLSKKRLASDPEFSLSEALERAGEMKELAGGDRALLEDFRALLGRLRAQKDRLKLSELLRWAVDQTAYEAKLMARPDGPQAVANVWKLFEMAASVEDKKVRGISDFILYLKSASDSSETEAEARIVGEEEDVVRIMTVHAAKGLEFPCVVLADLGGGEGKTFKPAFTCSPEHGLGARLKDPVSLEFCEDVSYTRAAQEEDAKEDEEAHRLFYVAMTRAEEHLLFSGVAQGDRMKGLEEELSAQKIPFHRVPIVSERPRAARERAFVIDALGARAEEASVAELERRLEPVEKKYESLEDLTVSRLVEAAAPPLPAEEPMEEDEAPEEEEDATPRNEFGTLFHFLMELSSRATPRGRLRPERFAELTRALTADEKKEIEKGFSVFWEGALGKGVKQASKCYSELPFLYKTPHGILKGQMDLVYKDRDGWVIVDYKTNRLSGPEDKKAAVETYRPQMGLYALAFWKLYGEVPKRTILYFTALGEAVEVVWPEKELELLSGKLDGWYRKALDF